jgi:hypothetical protein
MMIVPQPFRRLEHYSNRRGASIDVDQAVHCVPFSGSSRLFLPFGRNAVDVSDDRVDLLI